MDGGGSGAASVWLASAGSDDLRSLFIYLGFDASAEDPGQLLDAAEWAALERPHRLYCEFASKVRMDPSAELFRPVPELGCQK
jgi:hypothetical protein